MEELGIVPVSRSYSGFDWEKVAGPYSQDLEVTTCSSTACTLTIPNLPDLNENDKFILMSFSHELTDKEQVSRFFHLTTFGPTKDMIDNWNYGTSLEAETSKWVKEQMTEGLTPITSHRAFYRKNLDRSTFYEGGNLDGSLASNPHYHPKHPCDRFARWRDYSFSADDYNFFPIALQVTHYHGGQYLISVNNIPRTIVGQWKTEHGHDIGAGQFGICKYCVSYASQYRLIFTLGFS